MEYTPNMLGFRLGELLAISQGSLPREHLPAWVHACLDRLSREFLGNECPDRTSPEFAAFLNGWMMGALPTLVGGGKEYLTGENGIKVGMSVVPDEHLVAFSKEHKRLQEEGPAALQGNMTNAFMGDFAILPHASRKAFAQGLLAGTDADKHLLNLAPSPILKVCLVLWICWPEASQAGTVPNLYSYLEKHYNERGLVGLPLLDAFKQFASRIGLSAHLRANRTNLSMTSKQL